MVKLPALLLASEKAILMPFTMVSVCALDEPVRGKLETTLIVVPWLDGAALGCAQAASARVDASAMQAQNRAGPRKRGMAPSVQRPPYEGSRTTLGQLSKRS